MNVKTSDQINELAAALSKAQGRFTNLEKNRTVKVKTKTGGEYEFAYATLDELIAMVRPVLSENGIALIQGVEITDGLVVVTTLLLHTSGQWIKNELPIVPDNSSPQSVGSAITYGRRYSVAPMLGLASEEDDDGNLASGNHAITRQPTPRAEHRQQTSPVSDSAPANDATAFWTWARAEMKTGRFTEPVVRQALAAHHNNFAQARETLEKTSGQHTAA